MQLPSTPTSVALGQWRLPAPIAQAVSISRSYAADLSVVLASYFVATYLRKELPFGKFVGYNYEWQSPRLYLTIALGMAAAYTVRIVAETINAASPAVLRFWTPVAGVALCVLSLTIFLPSQSGLEKIYFSIAALGLLSLVVPSPAAAQREENLTIGDYLGRLWANRALLRIWVRYNVQSRYAQAFLGILWIVLLPLSTAFVMSVVFSQVMRVQIHDAPFIAFFLAGYVPWGLFNQSIGAGMRSILSAMNLINQIYFPREIIVVSALGEAVIDFFFMFAAMMVIDLFVGVRPNFLYLVLPFLLVIQLALCLGLMFVVSWLSVLIRDVPQLVSVLLQILFYLSPIIYPVSIVPHHFRFLITLNPVAVIIQAYHQIVVYGHAPDWFSLVYPTALGVALLIFGYRYFKSNEDRMADMV